MSGREFTLTRRQILRAGFGAVAVRAGLAWPGWASAAPSSPPKPARRARSLIVLWMEGGPSHIDTWDPKPGTPEGGPFRALDTAVAGLRVGQHLPRLARQAKRLAVVRSVTSNEGDHGRATVYVRTGRPPLAATPPPGIGAVVSRERAGKGPALRAVSVLAPGPGAGFVGAEHAPLLVVDPEKPLEGWFAEGLEPDVLARRAAVLEALERAAPGSGRLDAEQRRVAAAARDFLGSPLVAAMDIAKEPAKVRDMYGRTPFGNGCLLARRLVEAEVPFVEVSLEGWDSHVENFTAHQRLCGILDPAFSALLDDLGSRGLLDSTMILWAGEFGRTPTINSHSGRDHHPRAFSAVLAGGPIRGGQVLGKTDVGGADVVERPVPVPDLLATVYTGLGISPDTSYVTADGRPITLLDKATPVRELLG